MPKFTIVQKIIIECRRSIKFLDFYAVHNGQFRLEIVEKLLFFDDFLPKMTYVRPKCVPWRSNQEWSSIGADTVYNFVLPKGAQKLLADKVEMLRFFTSYLGKTNSSFAVLTLTAGYF